MFSILSLSSSGHLYLHPSLNENAEFSPIQDKRILSAFDMGTSEGLFALASANNTQSWCAVLHFWREFVDKYFNCFCRRAESELIKMVPPPMQELEEVSLSLPPMLGAEYCDAQVLHDIWVSFDEWLCHEITGYEGGITAFLAKKLPSWHQVGRVCFHLAENKKNPGLPFAFLATYASKVGKNARVQYLPLHYALQEYAGAGNKEQLLKLLKPIYEASKQCPWLEFILTNRDIYQPLAWTAEQAYKLLNSVSQLENSGIVVRLPDWWKKRPRPRVQISIGNDRKQHFNVDAMLDFKLNVAIEGKPLSQEELDFLLSSESGLISLRGQWVEVDKEKLKEALEHWQSVQKDAGDDGVSFIEGMRLLAGTSKDFDTQEVMEEEQRWAYVNAGDWLNELLTKLRTPQDNAAKELGTLLKAELRPYQKVGVSWLDFLTELGLGSCLADDMGLGKTIQIIALLLIKKQQRKLNPYPSILVMPASLLSNWKSELARFAPSLQPLYLHASELHQDELSDLLASSETLSCYDVVLTTYGMLLRQTWLQERQWHLVILDEAQAIKNPSSRQTKMVKSLRGKARIALTGTPIENRLGDLWSLFDFLCPNLLGTTTQFKKYIKNVNSRENASFAPLRKLVQPYILRRLKTDKSIISDLPDKTEVVAWCGLSKTQAKLYADNVRELSEIIRNVEGIKRKGIVLSYLMRFKQICNHPSQFLGDSEYANLDSGKFIRLAEICEEIASRQEKVLIFTQFKEMTGPLALFLSNIFSRAGILLHGSTPVKQRKNLIEQFQQENGPPFFVLSLKAAGTGLNLTAANHVIHFDRWWNPAVENQATDRAFRIGQNKNVLVHKFVCRGTIEEKIDILIKEKVELANDVLSDGGEALLTELDDKALLNLVSLDLDKSQF